MQAHSGRQCTDLTGLCGVKDVPFRGAIACDLHVCKTGRNRSRPERCKKDAHKKAAAPFWAAAAL